MFCLRLSGLAQTSKTDEKAEAVLKKAVQVLGGDNYLKVRSQIGRGKFSLLRDGVTGFRFKPLPT